MPPQNSSPVPSPLGYKERGWCCLPLGGTEGLGDRAKATFCLWCQRNRPTQPMAGSVAGEGDAAVGHITQLSLSCAEGTAPLYKCFCVTPCP